MFVDIGNVKDATRMDNHHKRLPSGQSAGQPAGVEGDDAAGLVAADAKTKRSKPEPSYMFPLLKNEKSLQDLLDDYVVYSEW